METFNNKIKNYQFSEKYLIKNIKYFNSNVCLENQMYLTPYFCFRYLYNNITEPIENRVYYNNIIDYFKNIKECNENMINIYNIIFEICINERLNNKNAFNEIKIQNNGEHGDIGDDKYDDKITPLFSCNAKCDDCLDKYCEF